MNNSEDVHAYPHFKLDSPLYPLPLGELSSIDFSGMFSVNVTSAYESQKQRVQSLDDSDVQYNIALDMHVLRLQLYQRNGHLTALRNHDLALVLL